MKKDSLYFCFRYKCKNCPKSKECEDKEKIVGDNNGKQSKLKKDINHGGSSRTR